MANGNTKVLLLLIGGYKLSSMKSIIYKNYDDECTYCRKSVHWVFRTCVNPIIFERFGSSGTWVVNCEGCDVRDLDNNGYEFKKAVLSAKLSTLGDSNGI